MSNRTALITGGSSGIGLATAIRLSSQGVRVMVTGRNPKTLAAARDQLPEGTVVLAADARSMSDITRTADEVRDRFGSLDAVFLNAGINRLAAVADIDEQTFDEVFATNTKGQFFTLQRVLPLLSDGASVLFTVGLGVTRGRPGTSVTAASRGALLAMVPALAAELAPRRIRVNAVSPGNVDSPMWTAAAGSPEAKAEIVASVSTGIPFARFGTPEEVAAVAAFLLSDDASYVTGQNVAVAGGL